MKTKTLKTIIAVAAFALAAGCTQYDPVTDSYITTYPNGDFKAQSRNGISVVGRSFSNGQYFYRNTATGEIGQGYIPQTPRLDVYVNPY